MTPLRVTAKNYGPYATLAWDIPSGLTAIVGRNLVGDGADSNGSGKTKLLELIPICLFGPSMPWSEYLTVGSEGTICQVELEFSHGGETYRVRRTYDSKGRGKTLLDFEMEGSGWHVEPDEHGEPLQVQSPPAWEPLTRGDQKETQALIETTIGLSESTFAHSVFAAQGARHFADPSLPPRERKAILTEALNLGVWDDLAKLCNADIADLKHEVEAIDQRVGAFEGDLAQKPQLEGEHAELTAQASLASADVTACEEAEAAVREGHAALKSAAAERDALTARRDATQGILIAFNKDAEDAAAADEQATTTQNQIDVLLPVAARAAELVALVNAITVADSTRDQATREKQGLLGRIAGELARAEDISLEEDQHTQRADALDAEIESRLNGNPGSCDHCGQALAGEALTKAVESLRRDREAVRAQSVVLGTRLSEQLQIVQVLEAEADAIVIPDLPQQTGRDELQRETAKAQQAVTDLAGLRERLANLHAASAKTTAPEFVAKHERAVADASAAQEALDAAPSFDPEVLGPLTRDLERASTDLVAARATDRQIQAQLATSEERLRNLAALAERVQEALLAKAGLQGRLDTLSALARSYGRDGIPALILEASAIPHVENEARRVLEQLGMPFRIELVTQRENKGGGLKDTLDVVVHEPNGSRQYQTYSGGERTRLELALRIALARLIAHQSSSHVGMLCLDEPAFLDATGMAQVAEVLRGLTEFRSIVLVSHDERLVEAFDQIVTVTRYESGSRLENAA